MEDESSFEDFSDATFFIPIEDEIPKKEIKKEENPFEILSMESILEDVIDMVQKVQSFLNLPIADAAVRAVLAHYKWDWQKVVTEYCEMDPIKFFAEAKVSNPFTAEEITSVCNDTDLTVCKICYDDEPGDLYGLKCDHKYCRDCWSQYLTTKIEEAGLTQLITCPDHNCDYLVDDEHVLITIDNSKIIDKYRRSMTNTFVMHNKALRWCPSAGCTFAAKRNRTVKFPCKCQCGFEFCFDCTSEYWHEPVSCLKLKQWKNSTDMETFKWIAEHAKPCPNCEASIEKNGGCNHMTCRHCSHEFCWICMGNWQNHNNCNRFDEMKTHLHAEFERFKHFQDRYGNQMESLRLEDILYRNLNEKVNELKETFSMTTNEVRFFPDAVKVLHISRRTLTYTFVFAYYLRKNNQVEIFEDNQSDLAAAVEKLSRYLEDLTVIEEITPERMVELKKNIQTSFKYCQQRCEVLLDHIREAEEKQLWKIN